MTGDHVKPVWVGGDQSGNDLAAPDAYMLTGQAAQDYADGAALRRLREALPEHVYLEIGWVDCSMSAGYWSGSPGGIREYEPYVPDADDDPEGWTVEAIDHNGPKTWRGHGATIAEAADKCREELG